MASTAEQVLPEQYFQKLCPPQPEPGFHDPGELERVWGAQWGSQDEVGRLRDVLMRRPGDEFTQIREDAWNEAAGALVDPNGGWYWESRVGPDLDVIAAQHAGLVETLEREGVRVHYADGLPPRFTKAVYTRDPLISLPGGMLIGRMAPAMRRGEEASITRAVAAAGAPILGTIIGSGMLEGGTFAKLTPRVAVFGTSIRCNAEAASQLEELLARMGIELIVVPMGGFSIHIDAHLGMVDVDKAVVDAPGLPHWFLDRLVELGIEPIWCAPDEGWAINCLAVAPGRVIMPDDCPRTAEALSRRGVEVIPVPYFELHKNGGGVHCSTMELRRDPAA
ncbi:MAG: dimethylarginine dimethylaminohydrolase family protein [Gaiellales bacterium]